MPIPAATAVAPSFLADGGGAGAAMRAFDWSATPLGAPEGWPQPLKTLVDVMLTSAQPMFVAWGPEHILLYNNGYAPMLADRHPRALGRPFFAVWPEIETDIAPLFARVFAGEPVLMDDITLFLDRPGRPNEAHFAFSYTPVRDEAGAVIGLFCACVETSEQVLAQRERQAAADRQRALFQQMPGFVAVLSGPEHRFDFVNDAYVEISGDRGFIGRTVREVFPDIAGQGFYERLDRAYATGEPFSARALPINLDRPDGERFIDLLYQPIRDASNAVSGIFVGGYDVTERVRSEHVLRASEARQRFRIELADALRGLQAEADIMRVVAERIGQHLGVDQSNYYLLDGEHFIISEEWSTGAGPSMIGRYPLSAFGDEVRAQLWANEVLRIDDTSTDPSAATFASFGMAAVLSAPFNSGGRWAGGFHVHSVRPRCWSDEEAAMVHETATRAWVEIERVRAEAALRESEARHAAITNSIDQLVWSARPDGYHDYFNDRWHAFTGAPFSAAEDCGWVDLFHPDDRERANLAWRHSLDTGEPYRLDYRLRHGSGEYRWMVARAQCVRDAAGGIVRWYGTSTDVHDRVVAEQALRDLNDTLERRVAARTAELEAAHEQLRQSQKLDAMGQLTGGVAHDFNNLLTPIVGSLDMLQRRGVGGEREQRMIAAAVQSADRAKTLVQRLLAFARRQPLQTEAVDVGMVVRGMVDLVASTSGPRVRVEVDVAPDLPPAEADANQVEMAILNLAVNARDAMPDGGTLTFGVAEEMVEGDADAKAKGSGRDHAGLAPGRYVRLSVADTGVGMDEATRKRAIEPFFSTKGVGKGTGLGLSMAHGLAAQLGGALSIDSRPGLGTRIDLWLPVAQAHLRPLEIPPPVEAVRPAGTVLLVDDEEGARLSTADMLDEMGYAVVEADTAEEALRLIADGLRPDLLVTDHLMPGLTGVELARELREQLPAMPALLVSGYADAEGVPSDLPRLTKPFRRTDLAQAVAAARG